VLVDILNFKLSVKNDQKLLDKSDREGKKKGKELKYHDKCRE